MNDGKIDFSLVDPKKDPFHWEMMVQGVLKRVEESKVSLTLLGQLVYWAKPALVMAAAVALLCMLGAVAIDTTGEASGVTSQSPAVALSSWASGESLPGTAQILTILGENHGNQ